VSAKHYSRVPGGRVLGPKTGSRTDIPIPSDGAGHQGGHHNGAHPANGNRSSE